MVYLRDDLLMSRGACTRKQEFVDRLQSSIRPDLRGFDGEEDSAS